MNLISYANPAKSLFITWYFNDVFGDNPKIPMDAFELAIEESNAACNWDMAEREYGRMITDYNDNPDTVITDQQLDETKDNCKGHEKDWKNAYCRLQAKWRQLKSKRKTDNSIGITKQGKDCNSDSKEGNFDL